MSRPSLAEIRARLLFELDDQWRTPSQLADTLHLGHGQGWLRVALVLERLAHEGTAELRNPRSAGRRYFRSAR